MKSGMIAAETINEFISNNTPLSEYENKFKKSWAHQELYTARNVKPSFQWSCYFSIIFTGIDQILFRGYLPFTLKHSHADHESLIPANKAKRIDYPKYD
jgi:electron-transferring-flavoprotein dehydrogenase